MKSLKGSGNELADVHHQLDVLNNEKYTQHKFVSFGSKLKEINLFPLKPTGIQIFQVNVGYMCNQTCRHCHVDAGPDRKEIMSKETMEEILVLIERYHFQTIDITGGAPEMNPNFRWFIEQIRKTNQNCKIIVRCNLTIILSNKIYNDLPDFFKDHQLEVVSSLPFYSADRTDRQRGEGVFDDSIKALQLLNERGYGKPGSGLILNLVYNPSGAFLPAKQSLLEKDFKETLENKYGIVFNDLFAITNMPINRFLDYLLQSGNYQKYMDKLIQSFNASAAVGVMCRNTLSVGWDGYLYDCDFNQMLGLRANVKGIAHIREFNFEELNSRDIVINQHCFGCTAGAGSSCAGAVAS